MNFHIPTHSFTHWFAKTKNIFTSAFGNWIFSAFSLLLYRLLLIDISCLCPDDEQQVKESCLVRTRQETFFPVSLVTWGFGWHDDTMIFILLSPLLFDCCCVSLWLSLAASRFFFPVWLWCVDRKMIECQGHRRRREEDNFLRSTGQSFIPEMYIYPLLKSDTHISCVIEKRVVWEYHLLCPEQEERGTRYNKKLKEERINGRQEQISGWFSNYLFMWGREGIFFLFHILLESPFLIYLSHPHICFYPSPLFVSSYFWSHPRNRHMRSHKFSLWLSCKRYIDNPFSHISSCKSRFPFLVPFRSVRPDFLSFVEKG